MDTAGESEIGLRNKNLAQLQASVAKKKEPCTDFQSSNLMSLSRDYAFEEVGLTKALRAKDEGSIVHLR